VTTESTRSLGQLDRGLYALFSRHADRTGHDRNRERYRAAALGEGFDVYLARVYGLSWVALLVVGVGVAGLALAAPGAFAGLGSALLAAVPLVGEAPGALAISPTQGALLAGLCSGLVAKRAVVSGSALHLRWRVAARRSDIEQTLPGAVRYLRVLATGTDDRRTMLRKVASQPAYGQTAVAFRTALNRASLTGSLDQGLETVARDTPSRDQLAPFLLKFREHANQGADALVGYLRMEGRMLSLRQDRARERTTGFLELLAELFVVLLVLPALLVLILTVTSVLAPGFSAPISTPLGETTVRAVLVYGSAAFVLSVGGLAAFLVTTLRPTTQAGPTHARPAGVVGTLKSATTNPASAAVLALGPALVVAAVCWQVGYRPANVLLLGYVAYGLPVGAVAVRRARIDDAKDREVKDFVHAVSGHVSLGRPFPEAVKRVARDVDSGALQPDVEALALNLDLTTTPERADGDDVRTAALDRFVDRVDTPLASQTIGLVTGALDVGSDPEDVFETLQTEVSQIYHSRKSLRASLMVYVAVGWTTALLVVGIMVAVNAHVLDGFAQLSAVSDAQGVHIDPGAVDPERDRWRFYLVTQATMLACGWFAGTASRGRYEALLHSAALVAIAYAVFAGSGMI
jgi:archaellum biogenesis protein FlaJ (TadC family)